MAYNYAESVFEWYPTNGSHGFVLPSWLSG